MDFQIGAILVQDAAITGSVYALLAAALVLVFIVTRIILIPQGDIVAFSALTVSALQDGRFPSLIWFLAGLSIWTLVLEVNSSLSGRKRLDTTKCAISIIPAFIACVLLWCSSLYRLPMFINCLICILAVIPLGTLSYRIFYQPIADASTLVLFIVSVALHLVFVGCGLFVFGADGERAASFSSFKIDVGTLTISLEAILIVLAAAASSALLYWCFKNTFYGKVLQAAAENRLGARLQGIPTELTGQISFSIAAGLAGLAGVLIAPTAVIYYDTGFIIGLKGFIAAIIGGLSSFPVAMIGALVVGLLESFSSFYVSVYKEVIVFALLIPVLLWRSFGASGHAGGDE